ncbi:hypothetical protein FRC02_004096 [Tulasnella sp. 418]|nr:hypothetical protein FRC02_004096 [Tulasnella sp. 418]
MDSQITVNTNAIVRLTHDNYVIWKERLITSLMMNHVWSVTTGQEPRPVDIPEWLTEDEVNVPEDLEPVDRKAVDKYRERARKWDEKNELATGIMITSVGDQHMAYVSTGKTAVENWQSLEAFGATFNAGVSAF